MKIEDFKNRLKEMDLTDSQIESVMGMCLEGIEIPVCPQEMKFKCGNVEILFTDKEGKEINSYTPIVMSSFSVFIDGDIQDNLMSVSIPKLDASLEDTLMEIGMTFVPFHVEPIKTNEDIGPIKEFA